MMKGICLFLITVIPLINGKEEKKTINIQKIVDEVNSDPTATWKASNYGFEEINEEEIKSKLGALFDKHHELLMKENLITKNKPYKNHHEKKNHQEDKNNKNLKLGSLGWDLLPVEYDARKEYPFCKSIGYIRDQANCGSCWAVSGASVLSDRFCIHSHGVYNMTLSGHYITACNYRNNGCRGGNLSKLWQFLEWYGTLTGDEYETDIGCQPYGIRPCGWPKKLACSRDSAITPKCEINGCNNEWYEGPEKPKRFYASESYEVGNIMTSLINEYQIKLEIFQNGPVQAGFAVYRDFLAYKSGVYAHKFRWFELPLGGHAVKIIGWGIEKGVKYWLVSNSWGEEWGEKGFFKIIRGRNDCFIESMVYAGMPEL